ncbi:hypothetical protein HG530_013322 [Fusarium avenaceum]|nr:hypothetical protein HG530_013322 [Fusarium avenaceum]
MRTGLAAETQAVDDGSVAGAEELSSNTADVLTRGKLLGDTGTESNLSSHVGQGMADQDLNGTVDGTREVKSPLHLPAVAGSKLGQNNHRHDLAVLLGSKVSAMLLVNPGSDFGKMDLLALVTLASVLPLFNGGVGTRNEIFIGLDLVDLDTLTLNAASLGSQTIDLGTVVLIGVNTLLLGTRQTSPAKLSGENLLDLE